MKFKAKFVLSRGLNTGSGAFSNWMNDVTTTEWNSALRRMFLKSGNKFFASRVEDKTEQWIAPFYLGSNVRVTQSRSVLPKRVFTSRGSCTSLKPELSSTLRRISRRGFFFGVDRLFARKGNIPCKTTGQFISNSLHWLMSLCFLTYLSRWR